MHEYAWDLLADRELVSAVIAEVQTSCIVVSLDHVGHGSLALVLLLKLALCTLISSLLLQSLALQL